MFALFVLAVAGLGAGIAALVVLVRGGSLFGRLTQNPAGAAAGAAAGHGLRERLGVVVSREAAVAALVVVTVLVVTRWPAAALVAGGAVLLWPRIAGGTADGRRQLATVEALAVWTESLRDASESASGLEQAIPATLPATPELLRRPVRDLVARLDGRVPLPAALALFADDVDDRAADMVVAALSLNARQRAGGLSRILSQLATASRSELEMRRKVEHQRRAVRRESQMIAGGVLALVTAQAVFSPGWLQPYDTALGQLVLLGFAVAFLGAFKRLRTLSRPTVQPRFLAAAADVVDVASFKPRTLTGSGVGSWDRGGPR